MPSYQEKIRVALDAYPEKDRFLHHRSEESKWAVKYLRGELTAGIDENTLRSVINYLLTGQNAPANRPADMRKLRRDGALYRLLDAVQRNANPLPVGGANKLLSEYNGTTKKMSTDAAASEIALSLRRKYDAAIAEWTTHRPQAGELFWENARNDERLASLFELSREEHLFIIDSIWNDILDLNVGRRPVGNMVDPDIAVHTYLSSSHLRRAFSEHGYCFRCDTRDPASVTRHGFRRQYEWACPEEIKDTLPHRAAIGRSCIPAIGLWKDNRDAVNQMAICVSRQMRGCTKFPDFNYTGQAWIYALCLPRHRIGFDTEAWQIQIGPEAVWRPGEKAFYIVHPEEVLASVPVYKSQTREGERHVFGHFQFLCDTWTYYRGTTSQRVHLKDELHDLFNHGEEQDILDTEDFYVRQAA